MAVTADALRAALSARPFRPFVIRAADRDIPVHAPESVALGGVGRLAVVIGPDGSVDAVDLTRAAAIEPAPPE